MLVEVPSSNLNPNPSVKFNPEDQGEGLKLSDFCGPYLLKYLEQQHLDEIADSLLNRVPLNQIQEKTLLKTSLPLLGKLVEISRCGKNDLPDKPNVRPVFYFPLFDSIEKNGSQAEDICKLAISNCLESSEFSGQLYLAIDRWTGKVPLEELLLVLQQIQNSTAGLKYQVRPYCPSTAELKQIMQSRTGAWALDSFNQDFFQMLVSAGIDSVEGGGNLDIHVLASKNGLKVCVGQNISDNRIVSNIKSPKQNTIPLVGMEFLNWINKFREKVLKVTNCECWFPWSPAVLDSGNQPLEAPLGLEMLHTIAIARLLLPEVRSIRAPLHLLRMNLAHVALLFGANDLGFAAIDQQTEKQLGMVSWQHAATVLAEHDLHIAKNN